MFRFILSILFIFLPYAVVANDCLDFKVKPTVSIVKPSKNISVVQPDESMNLSVHGNVVASLSEQYSVVAEMTFVKTGFCVTLSEIDMTFGYDDFIVKIDKSYAPNSCAYNAVMSHEQQHIDTYLSVIDDFQGELKQALAVAADSVMPIFIEKKSEFDSALEMMNQELQAHPDLILVKQKIKAAEEIRNKKIDQVEDGSGLMKCFE